MLCPAACSMRYSCVISGPMGFSGVSARFLSGVLMQDMATEDDREDHYLRSSPGNMLGSLTHSARRTGDGHWLVIIIVYCTT